MPVELAQYAHGPALGRVITAMVTPFDSEGRVDYGSAERLAAYLVANGSDGLVVSGTTGESPTLSHAEKLELFRVVKKTVGSVPVVAGVGSNDTRATVELSRDAARTGVDGLLLVAPYYSKPSQEGLFQHFTAAADATDLPVLLYNVPGRTGTNIEPSTVVRLSSHPRIVGIKEASLNLAQIGDIALSARSGFLIYSGSDEVNLPVLALGGVGVISVISHLAGADLRRMIEAFETRDFPEALRLHLRTLPLTKAMFGVPSPTPTKTALQMLGVLESGAVRLPLVAADDAERAVIRAALAAYGLLH
ncbi:MAG: 4-hydroxy-tetrahydrodipicolinate synthase [Capsulimonadaceae bacterium]